MLELFSVREEIANALTHFHREIKDINCALDPYFEHNQQRQASGKAQKLHFSEECKTDWGRLQISERHHNMTVSTEDVSEFLSHTPRIVRKWRNAGEYVASMPTGPTIDV